MKLIKKINVFFIFLIVVNSVAAQNIPFGLNYQAVARNAIGEELKNVEIDVRFSILSGSTEGVLEYQEVHTDVRTSGYGVFNLVIGKGNPVGGAKSLFDELTWEMDDHFVRVEIKFDQTYLNMGEMKFLSVPYALYAARSLEPGPIGPTGPAGDPATDDQTLSFDGENLEISGGNTINLAAMKNNPTDEIQYLSIKDDSLSITGGNAIKLQEINIDDADADPTNEIQDLRLTGDLLKVTGFQDALEIDLSAYKDNTDNQTISFNETNKQLTISGGNTADLSVFTNTDDQQISYNSSTYELSLEDGNSVTLGELVAFRSSVNTSITLPDDTNIPLIFDGVVYDESGSYNSTTGEFTPGFKGNYTFNVSLTLPFGLGSAVILIDGVEYETIVGPTSGSGTYRSSITMRLLGSEKVSIAIKQTNGYTLTGVPISGFFSGFRVY